MADDELLPESPSQTAGPYVHIGCMPNACGIEGVYTSEPGSVLVTPATRGERISITGCVYDGEGEVVKDAVLEIWQADADGFYPSPADARGDADPNFSGWGRAAADLATGEYRFDTIRPGRVPFTDGRLQAPHITCWIVARGINLGLQTRIYFDDESEANAQDPLLSLVEPRSRIETLLAVGEGDGRFRFDIHLQGARETVFLDI